MGRKQELAISCSFQLYQSYLILTSTPSTTKKCVIWVWTCNLHSVGSNADLETWSHSNLKHSQFTWWALFHLSQLRLFIPIKVSVKNSITQADSLWAEPGCLPGLEAFIPHKDLQKKEEKINSERDTSTLVLLTLGPDDSFLWGLSCTLWDI